MLNIIKNIQKYWDRCSVRHANRYIKYDRGVVYEIPFSRGKVYVGQTVRCVNTRLREHELSLKSSPSSHHSLTCGGLWVPPVVR